MIRLILAANAIHLEAARRLRDGLLPECRGVEILLWEPERFSLTPADRHRWPVRLPVRPMSYLLLAPFALLGLIGEFRLSHLSGAGVGLRLILRRARRLTLLDDGLDQYRARPKAVDPGHFPAGIDCWLFSDAPAWRAPWCGRFHCRELGPLFVPSTPGGTTDPLGGAREGTLIIDSPGIEPLQDAPQEWPHPWCVVPHPVAAKRSWRLPPGTGDGVLHGAPEALLPSWRGTVVVGESLMLLAALRLRAPGTRLVLALPRSVDPHLQGCVAAAAIQEEGISLV